jgi:RNA polymerase sigma factor (sigma-70 family)
VVVDFGELYLVLSPRLRQLVLLDVTAPEPVIEDACQTAWSRLIRDSERVTGEAALAWLAITAVREAFKLCRRDERELSLDAVREQAGELPFVCSRPGPAEAFELHERLAEVDRLPERQQRLVWLRAVGLSYVEIAERTGDTARTVERQLQRARGKLAAAA